MECLVNHVSSHFPRPPSFPPSVNTSSLSSSSLSPSPSLPLSLSPSLSLSLYLPPSPQHFFHDTFIYIASYVCGVKLLHSPASSTMKMFCSIVIKTGFLHGMPVLPKCFPWCKIPGMFALALCTASVCKHCCIFQRCR